MTSQKLGDEPSPTEGGVRVAIASPLGKGGMGGMDRMADLLIETLEQDPSCGIVAQRLTTRGQWPNTGHGRFKKVLAPVRFATAMAQLTVACATGRVDVLHLNLAADGSFVRKFMMARVARAFGVPYVVHIHTGRFEAFWNRARGQFARSIETLLANSAAIIVLGRSFETMITSRLPDLGPKIRIVANATSARPPVARVTNGPVNIAFLGVLVPQKGVPQLLEALGGMRERNDWTATLAGYGDINAWRAEAARLGIAERVNFPGWLDATGVDELLASSQIYVLPSFSEGLPMSILEAFSAGIPVVATPLNAITDVVVPERNGLLVPVGDVPALQHALERLVGDHALRERLGAAARADHAARYDLVAHTQMIVSIWREAAATRTARQTSVQRRT